MGGRSSSDSSQTTHNTDKRLVNESGVAVSADSSNVTLAVETLSDDVVKSAFDYAKTKDATNAAGWELMLDSSAGNYAKLVDAQSTGFGDLLSLVDKLTTKTQDTASTLAARYTDDVMSGVTSIKAEQEGRFDQQTIVILGVAAVVGLVALNRKGK